MKYVIISSIFFPFSSKYSVTPLIVRAELIVMPAVVANNQKSPLTRKNLKEMIFILKNSHNYRLFQSISDKFSQ